MANPKPVAEVRIGPVKAAIWRNETANSTRHNVTFSRLYKDGDQWKTTQSFARDDLLVLANLSSLLETTRRRKNEKSPPKSPRNYLFGNGVGLTGAAVNSGDYASPRLLWPSAGSAAPPLGSGPVKGVGPTAGSQGLQLAPIIRRAFVQ